MIVAIASGKGGTGKTTLAVNLAKVVEGPIQLLDCDVEEPNAQLFVNGSPAGSEVVNVSVPQVDSARCSSCGECVRFCRFNAIAMPDARPLIFPELCHGCGGCVYICPQRAISEANRRIGRIETFASDSLTLRQGCLDVGVALTPPLVRAVKEGLRLGMPAIIDAPPGAACPMVAALRGSDFVVLVTEPTPFGLNDLILAVETVRKLRLPFGVVINRASAGDDRVHAFCRREGITLLGEIPDDRRIAEAYSRGEVLVDVLPEYRHAFQALLGRIEELQ